MTDLVWSFAPWIVFMLADRFVSYPAAIALGLVAGIVVCVRAVGRHQVHMFDVVSVVYFVGLAAVVGALHPHDLDTWSRYSQAGSHLVLTAIVFGSIALGHPFTESYARQTTPKEFWDTDAFHATNHSISSAWGLAFLVGTVSLIAAGATGQHEALLRVIIPFGSLVMAFKYTAKASAAATDDAPGRPVTSSGS